MIAEAYLSRDFNGNFFDLFDFISEEKNGFTMHFQNKTLDGLVESIKNGCGCRICGANNSICKKILNEITYSNDKIAKIYTKVLAKELSKDSM